MGRRTIARRRAGAAALAVAVVGLVWLLLAGGGDPEPSEEATTAASPDGPSPAPADPATGLSGEELVDQVLLVGFEGSKPSAKLLDELSGHQLGGVLIGSENWDGAGPGAKLIDAIRGRATDRERIAPLIVTAQEGGSYRALEDLPPSEREIEIGDRNDAERAVEWSEESAAALADVGIDLNLAPVADVATLDSPIADRAFSDDAAVVTAMIRAALRGCRRGGIACAVSHFPGLGAASQDTNEGPASIGLDIGTLRGRDLVPFAAAFQAGARAVVVSHGLYAAYDAVTPASLLPAISTGLLRGELDFDGVAISDDIGAGAITASSEPADAAVAAIDAGIDLLQVRDPDDVEPVRRALLAALEDGTLSEERLREAARRVLALKRELERGKGKGKKG